MILSINASGLTELLEKFSNFNAEADEIIQGKLLESVKENIVAVAKSLAPKRTGALAESIDATASEDPLTVLLTARKPYARYMEYGTQGPYSMEAKNAKSLAFQVNGHTIFAKSVQHPGIPAGRFSFLRPAIDAGKNKVANDIANVILEHFR